MEPGKISQKQPIEHAHDKHMEEEAGFGNWLAQWVEKIFGVEIEKTKEEYVNREGHIVPEPASKISSRMAGKGQRILDSVEFNPSTLEIPEDSYSEDLIDEYNERIYENQRANWDIIFTKLERDVFKGFDRKVYEWDPMRFMSDLGSNARAVDVFNDLTWEDKAFGDAWEAIRAEQVSYFQGLVDEQYEDDPDYRGVVARYDELNDFRNEAIDDLKEGEGALWDKFENNFRKEYNELSQYLHGKNTECFNGMAIRYYAKDKEFQHALRVVQFEKEKLKLEGPESMVDGLYIKYGEDEAFKKCIDCINDREAKLRNLFYFVYSEEDISEKGAIVSPRLDWVTLGREAKKIRDFVQEHRGVILTPAVGLAAFILGSPVTIPTYALGGVFAYHFIDRVITSTNKVGVDLKTAKEDRELRMPYLERIFALEVSEKEKLNFMKQLYENGVLFTNDLEEIDESLREEFFKGIERGEESILSLEEVVEGRKPLLKILNDPYATQILKIDALERLYRGGLLYKSDIDQNLVDTSIKNAFFDKINKDRRQEDYLIEDGLRDMKALKPWRNAALFLIRGVDLGMDDKLQQMKELNKKGLLFREDMKQFEQAIGGKKLIERFYKEERIYYEKLPELASHYTWKKSDLRRADNQKRIPCLEKLENADRKVQLEGLHELQKMGLCFKQDLDKVSDSVRSEFGKSVNLNQLSDRAAYYRVGLGERFVRIVSVERAIGTVAIAGGIAMAGGIISGGGLIGGGLIAGGLIGGFRDIVDDPAKVVAGALVGVNGVIEITAEAMDATFGSFLYSKATAIQDRVIKVLPTNAKIKEQATFATNKVIGGMKWGVLGAAIGSQIAGIFGVKVGFAVGSFFGFCSTNGRVKQVPPGGFIRAIKFSSIGALVGSLVPLVLGMVVGGLALAGLIAASTALTVATMGLGLVIPCLLFGIFAGYQIAGFTGKDEELKVDDPVVKKLEYKIPTFEVAKALLLA